MPDIRCPDCGAGNTLTVHLSDGDTITCTDDDCGAAFDAATVEEQAAAWTSLAAWLRRHPDRPAMPTAAEQRQAASESPIVYGDDVPL